MKSCPYCQKEVENMRGPCPHCGKSLDAEGVRQMMLDQKGTLGTLAEEVQKIKAEAATRAPADIKPLEERMRKIEDFMRTRPMDEKSEKLKPISFGKLVGAIISKDWTGAEYERKAVEEGNEHRRQLGIGTIGIGGAVVAPAYMPQEFIDMLRSALIIEKLGAKVLGNLTGSPVLIPRLASGATAFDVQENKPKTAADPTFEQLTMVPHEVAAATIWSKRLDLLSNPAIEGLVQADLMAAVARRIDWNALYGNGAGGQALGVILTPGITPYLLPGDVGQGATPGALAIDGMELALANANAFIGNVGWAMAPRTKFTFKALRDDSGPAPGTGQYLFRDDIKAGKLDGYILQDTTQIPINLPKGASVNCSHLILGNWSDLILGYWAGIEIAVSDQAGDVFLNNQIIVKVSMLYDIGLRHPASFVVANGVRP